MAAESSIGREFEDAVRLIEESILKRSPGYRKDLFVLEPRKRVHHRGVVHEIDLYVTVDHENGYRSIFIFECKARKEPVSKNDILIFAAKVSAVQAQAGFFVAPVFGKYARAQAVLEPRVELLDAKIVSGRELRDLPLAIETIRNPNESRVDMSIGFQSEPPPDFSGTLDAETVVLHSATRDVSLADIIYRWRADILNEQHGRLLSAGLTPGTYTWSRRQNFKFKRREWFIDDAEVSQIYFRMEAETEIVRPPLNVRFDISGRGTVDLFAPVEQNGGLVMNVSILHGGIGSGVANRRRIQEFLVQVQLTHARKHRGLTRR